MIPLSCQNLNHELLPYIPTALPAPEEYLGKKITEVVQTWHNFSRRQKQSNYVNIKTEYDVNIYVAQFHAVCLLLLQAACQ